MKKTITNKTEMQAAVKAWNAIKKDGEKLAQWLMEAFYDKISLENPLAFDDIDFDYHEINIEKKAAVFIIEGRIFKLRLTEMTPCDDCDVIGEGFIARCVDCEI